MLLLRTAFISVFYEGIVAIPRVQETAQAIRFVPVAYDVTPVIKTSLPIKVVVKDRYVIEVADGFTPETLKEVLRVLEVA